MPAECECSPEHSVVKLGHSGDCPYVDKHRVVFQRQASRSIVTSCGTDICRDGAPHDFNWATYDDEIMSTGVCRCGLRELDLLETLGIQPHGQLTSCTQCGWSGRYFHACPGLPGETDF